MPDETADDAIRTHTIHAKARAYGRTPPPGRLRNGARRSV